MITVQIINYKTYELTLQTIKTLMQYTIDVDYEILLIDNASDDQSLEQLKISLRTEIEQGLIKVIANPQNGGFAYGNNRGLAKAKGDIIALMNSDMVIQNNVLKAIQEYYQENGPSVIIGPKVVRPNGVFEHGSKRGFPTLKASFLYFSKLDKFIKTKENDYCMLELHEDRCGEVDAISGSFLVIPQTIIQDIGLLDETFFMYGEDLDWCYRAKKKGFKVIYNPELGTVIHFHGQSGKANKNKKVTWEFYRAMLVFYKKHYGQEHFFLTNGLVYIAILLLFFFKRVKNILKS